jgi:glycosyltransferase involved in cell wall biosynthesis
MGKPVVIIPAYQPGEQLIALVKHLVCDYGQRIVLIDDGSKAMFQHVFTTCRDFNLVSVIAHQQNRGKGAALRTGFRFVLENIPDCCAGVTADADGQHRPHDIVAICTAAERYSDAVILGARGFAGEVPWRSRLGNDLTRSMLKLLFARRLGDTQTGLRAIPMALLVDLIRLKSERYSYELEMLVSFITKRVPIVEIPITTIYEKGNETSHFRPVRDSLAIYVTLARLWLFKR